MALHSPRYSICITNYNCVGTLENSLGSILNQITDEFEVVVVDNLSTDGSRAVLEDFAGRGEIKLIEEKSSRGRGRQLASQKAEGEYVISGLDMDETFKPALRPLIDFYHEKCEGKLLRAKSQGTIVAPRHIVTDLGGWRDLQYGENWDLARRAADAGLYRWTIFLLTKDFENPHLERKSLLGATKHRYIAYRESLRIGHHLFQPGESVGWQKRLIAAAAFVSSPFYGSFGMKTTAFTSNEPEYFVDSMDWWPNKADIERERERYARILGRDLP
jgi:glycosyltransferase involved in cell wall biosynthesis